MKTLFAFLLCVASSAQAQQMSAEFQKRCEELPASQLSFKVARLAPVVDQKHGARQLRAMVAAAPEDVVLSATEQKGTVGVELTRHAAFDPATGMHCARFIAIVMLGEAPQEVHIASELPQDSCLYDRLLSLEMHNVRNNLARLEDAAEELNAMALQEFGRHSWLGDLEQIDAGLRALLTNVWLARAGELLHPVADSQVRLEVALAQVGDAFDCSERKRALTATLR